MKPNYWTTVMGSRMRRRRALAVAGSTALAASILTACGGDEVDEGQGEDGASNLTPPKDTTKEAKRGGVLKSRIYADAPSFDVFTANSPLWAVGPMAYSSLLQFKPGYLQPRDGDVTGDVAESWEFSPDGLQVTMKLRPGVKFHNKSPVNGRALDMEDILFSWARFVEKHTSRALLANSVEPSAPVLSLTAADSSTIVIKLKEPVAFILGYFANNYSGNLIVVPKETDSTFNIRSDMIGTGPFEMAKYEPSVGYTFKRHPEFYDQNYALVDELNLPIISEYSTALGQLKAGNILYLGPYLGNISPEDVLAVKGEEPRLNLYKSGWGGIPQQRLLSFGWLPEGSSPFLDERVRQAVSMAWDRDLHISAFRNVESFENAGLPVDIRWNSGLPATYEGWWLDPKEKEFGPNARYFQYDPAEAKKLLAAAGYPNGFETVAHYVASPALASEKYYEIISAPMRDVGIRSTPHVLDYNKEYIPAYRTAQGQYEGWALRTLAAATASGTATGLLVGHYWSKGGEAFAGFSTSGRNDRAGDPELDTLLQKARIERDINKQKTLVNDVQRHLAKKVYALEPAGISTEFNLVWPALRNYQVFQEGRHFAGLWVDTNQPPLGGA